MRRRMGRPGLLGTMARTAVVASTATAVSGRTSRRMDRRAAEQAPAPPSEDDRMARIRELGEMRSNGLLTDDEFTAEKARILAS
jgi:hypothetical protein